MSKHRRIIAVALAAAGVACGPFHRGGPPDAVVMFNNESLNQADVYAVRSGGEQVRIGTVFAGRREPLRVPASLTASPSNLSIAARVFASSRIPDTGLVTLSPGDTIEVTLHSDLRTLTVLPARP